MKLLLDSKLVEVTKNGKERIYRLNMDTAVRQLKSLLASLEEDINMTPE